MTVMIISPIIRCLSCWLVVFKYLCVFVFTQITERVFKQMFLLQINADVDHAFERLTKKNITEM